MDIGPSSLVKLPFNTKTSLIRSHQNLPYLLRISNFSLQNYNLTHQKIAKQIPISQQVHQISHLNYSNKKLIYATRNCVKINEIKLHAHSNDVKHLLVDNSGLIVTAAEHRNDRCIKIISTFQQKQPKITSQFNFHYDPISALYWRNSLIISGDTGGQVCLWDINKCQTIFNRKAHYEQIRFIGAYVDYTINNIFYTVSPNEKRIIFSDLRTNKPIKILANLHSEDVITVGNTHSGKIFIAYKDIVDVIDIHHQYKMIGNFSPVVMDKLTQMKWTAKSFSYSNLRSITHAKTMGKYLVVGCDNGCIEVYDTDTLECLYGFGLVKFGPIKDLQCNLATQFIFGLDGEGDVYMAKFNEELDTKF